MVSLSLSDMVDERGSISLPHPVQLQQAHAALQHPQQVQPHPLQQCAEPPAMPSGDDEAFSLSFVRGDNGSEFLDDAWNYSTSVQTIPGAAGEAGTNSAANDLKVIAKSIGAMGRTERRLLTAGKWLKVLKANGED